MRPLLLLSVLLALLAPARAFAQITEQRIEQLERRVHQEEALVGGGGFIAGIVCALWAQNTRRNAWLWFFLGFFFSVFALLVLLYKNSKDLRRLPRHPG